MAALFMVLGVIGGIAAVVVTVLAYIYIIPERKREELKNPWLIRLHDILNFKVLFVERITKFLYVFFTSLSVIMGCINFIMALFAVIFDRYLVGKYFVSAIGLLVITPILLRVGFELVMFTILLVQNVIEINKKLKDNNNND